MGKGNLTIQARLAAGALPISGVRIKISDSAGRVLYNLVTDENGETQRVSLSTVDRQFSLDPNYAGTPYTSYSLDAAADGFNKLHIYGVQIFDGETAIQPVPLTPMSEGQKIPALDKLHFGKHGVEMSGDRPPPYSISNAEPFVMRQVIIPNPITVHLGTPASNASNIQVPFIDYIKNVASSEIYSTWPQASLEANIYAIITFALNRVFTQWYRSRDYNFDITNSTAYDQYFVYGHTIYESISKIADEIFNQYVRRAGQIAPFFTSFCNGTTSTCAGLSQWGTVSLANQGKTAIQILRNYYPNDIEISQTDIITGIVVSFPGTTLRVGSTGLAVQTMQTYLNRIRRNYPAIPQITDDAGVFGESTKAAVTKFQSIFNMTADGVIGKSTWNRISYIYVAVARLAELNSEGTALGIGTVPPSTILKTGSSGVDVITLQYILSFIGRFYPTIPELTQDGIFGNSTAQAVMAYQQLKGLNSDGVVGANTWNSLYDTYWGVRDNVPLPEPGPETGYITHTVQSGDTLWKLAQRFNTTVAAIKALNNLTSDSLSIGQILRIPTMGESGGGQTPSTTHTVQSGDTLWKLAQRFNTTVAAIKALNNLTSDSLSIGQVLRIPTTGESGGGQTPSITHTVQSGDTLWKLAQRFNTTVAAIKSLNNLTSDSLSIGQVLRIPSAARSEMSIEHSYYAKSKFIDNDTANSVVNGNTNNSYIVLEDDTLPLIAQNFGTTAEEIKMLNNLSSNVLDIGQSLKIPNKN